MKTRQTIPLSNQTCEDCLIHCLKEGHAGLDVFKEQLSILNEPDLNPFARLVSKQDIADATPEAKLIYINEEEKINIFLV